jgi:hypothetical protein
VSTRDQQDDEVPAAFRASEALIRFTEGDLFPLDPPFNLIVSATFMRSRETFAATHNLVAYNFSVQAAMLVRSLFEDMVLPIGWCSTETTRAGWSRGSSDTATPWPSIRTSCSARQAGIWGGR